jgi:phosphatidylinositol alpha-1,6-mannosyltransferase
VDLPGIVVPPGVDVERFTPVASAAVRRSERLRFGLDPDRATVVAVSRLVPRKGFDVLLDALALLELDVQLVIAGGGRDRRRLETRAGRLGLGDRVRFLGRVSDEDLSAVYRCGDVFAMMCRERWAGLEAEGFGIVFLEAAACGIPSVAGRSGGSHEAVVDEKTGFVVDPGDVTLLAQTLERLVLNPGLTLRLGTNARTWSVECSYDARMRLLRPLAAGDFSVLSDLPSPL